MLKCIPESVFFALSLSTLYKLFLDVIGETEKKCFSW